MQFLTYELAQEIVERTMKILNHNINVMNDKGMIIGSGDRERVNQLHDGALFVLKHGESFEIDKSTASGMQGTKPGINLPIHFNNQIVGVIGITGEPEEIRNYAQLVKMAAELVLEQSLLLERVQWKQRLQSEIVNRLIFEKDMNEQWVRERAQFLGINVDQPRVAIVFEQPDHTELTIQELLRSVQYEIDQQDLMGVTFNNEIVIFKAANTPDKNGMIKRLLKTAGGKALIGIGSKTESLKELIISFQQAKKAILVGSKLQPKETCFKYEDYQLEIMLARTLQDEKDKKKFSFYQILLSEGKNRELVETLEAYIRENGEVNKIAESLFIHRNTLRYRLEKITEITGKDPKNIRDLIELYLAKLMNELNM